MSEGEPDSYLLKINKILKTFFKKRFLFISPALVFILSGILVFISGKKIQSLSFQSPSPKFIAERSFYNKNTFIYPIKNFLSDSPEISFVGKTSLLNVSSPVIVTPQILGTLTSGEGSGARNEIIKYKVKAGDTLSSIAADFNVSLQTILWVNNLNSRSTIKSGQELIILPVSGILYSVRKNDTLEAIARRYKADVEKIIAFNNLSAEGDIFIGDLLIIPGGKMPAKIFQPVLTPVAKSYFIFPAQGKISQGFHYFNAVDIANKCGQPVAAAAGGIIKRAGWIRIGGRRITILHPNGVVTYYGHLSKILVGSGQKVNTGDIIGYIGHSGYTLGSTGCHLHFEVIGAKNFLSRYPVGSYISWKK
jgi:murein DD-endopeptidase MepM/ murein hydrolase activator NlpD